jgi:hypothetical protein
MLAPATERATPCIPARTHDDEWTRAILAGASTQVRARSARPGVARILVPRGGGLCYRSLAAWYCSNTLAGMRPRSLTARPCSFAQARISPER